MAGNRVVKEQNDTNIVSPKGVAAKCMLVSTCSKLGDSGFRHFIRLYGNYGVQEKHPAGEGTCIDWGAVRKCNRA